MNKKLIWAVGLIVVIGAAAALVPLTFSSDSLKRQVAAQVKEATGLNVETKGRVVIAFLPRPRIKLSDVHIEDPAGALTIESEEVHGNLRLLPMLAGHFELANIDLVVPTLDVNIDGNPLSATGAIARAVGADPATASSQGIDAARLGIISIESGLARVRSAATGAETLISDINLTLDWRRLASPAALTGSFSWRSEPAQITAWVQNPAALLRGADSAATIAIDSRPLTLTMDGSLVSGANSVFAGQLRASTPSLRRLAGLFGVSSGFPGPLANATLTGTAKITAKSVALSAVDLAVDGNRFEGTLAVAAGAARPAISGTLAADFFASAPLVQDLPPLVGADGGWNSAAFDPDGLDFADLDLRISATHARISRYQLEDAGMSILLKNGNLEVSLAEAKAYGGKVDGRVNLKTTSTGTTLEAKADFSGLDAGALLDDGAGVAHVTGQAKGNFEINGSGTSVAGLVHSLAGNGELTVASGEIIGIDLEQALRRLEKRPLSIASEVRSGRTGFDTLSGSFSLADGVASLGQVMVNGPGIALSMNGNVMLADRRVDLHALAQQTGADAQPRANGPQLHLDIAGPWEAPLLGFDADSLIRRSEAAAPLYGTAGPPADPVMAIAPPQSADSPVPTTTKSIP